MSTDQASLLTDGRATIRRELPLIAVNLITAALVWLFGVLVFLPLSREFSVLNLVAADKLVAAIFMIALLVLCFRLFGNVKRLTEGLADVVAARTAPGMDPSNLQRLRRAARVLMYILLAVIAYLFFLPFLASVAFVLAGIVLLVLALWAIATLFAIGDTLSEAIRHWADQAAQRIDRSIAPDGDGSSARGANSDEG